MAGKDTDLLRLRLCHGYGCYTLFWICRHCDRGQRYCSPPCRASALREQRRQANHRYQQSLAGRQDHRDRQRAYRKRCAQRHWASTARENVTDKSSPALAPARNMLEWHSGSTSITAQVDSATPLVQFRTLLWRKPSGAHRPPFLRCVICGRRGSVRDPFPSALRM
jgi:hypothetical protein